MKSVLTIATLLVGSMAFADGFVCTSESGLNVKVFHHTQPEMGTRTAAIMVISDSQVGGGNKTIAKFTDVKGTLSSSHLTYVGNVDLRFADSRKKGELIGGTKLGQLDTIELDVNFSYMNPLENGELTEATLTLNKRNGDQIIEAAQCVRYLKN
ncbi:MAG: hypothetical protein BroJett040_14990 [Oligoflexia bacterium]|nr:MAG: hypothetical protein BroJett040_14990 [Oligoflexia bacterium]